MADNSVQELAMLLGHWRLSEVHPEEIERLLRLAIKQIIREEG